MGQPGTIFACQNRESPRGGFHSLPLTLTPRRPARDGRRGFCLGKAPGRGQDRFGRHEHFQWEIMLVDEHVNE
jgi:hypothetical protein